MFFITLAIKKMCLGQLPTNTGGSKQFSHPRRSLPENTYLHIEWMVLQRIRKDRLGTTVTRPVEMQSGPRPLAPGSPILSIWALF